MSAVRLTGTLVRDAQARICTDGTALLDVMFSLGEGVGPLCATRNFGHGYAAQHVCELDARRYRKGMQVTLHARGFAAGPRDQHLTVLGVDHLELLTITSQVNRTGEPA